MGKVKAQTAYNNIAAHIRDYSTKSSRWYCGITNDPARRVFIEHNVTEGRGTYIFQECRTIQGARAVEEAIIKNKGCDGGTGGSKHGRYVYAYKKTLNTKP